MLTDSSSSGIQESTFSLTGDPLIRHLEASIYAGEQKTDPRNLSSSFRVWQTVFYNSSRQYRVPNLVFLQTLLAEQRVQKGASVRSFKGKSEGIAYKASQAIRKEQTQVKFGIQRGAMGWTGLILDLVLYPLLEIVLPGIAAAYHFFNRKGELFIGSMSAGYYYWMNTITNFVFTIVWVAVMASRNVTREVCVG